MNYNQITVGIVTFKSEKVIFNCLKSIKKIKKIIILDNSNDKALKKKIEKKYPKITILLSKKNLGYGVANNKIIKKSKTPFVFILSPDVILKKNCEENLLKSIKKLKYNFSILSPTTKTKNYGFIKKEIFSKNQLLKVDYVYGFAILMNKNKIKNVGFFDEKIFLYTEEIDLCKRLRSAGQNIYINKEAKVLHLATKSTSIGYEFEKCRNWHWMWSQVYFDKKNYNNFFVNKKYIYKLVANFFKFCIFSLLLNKRQVIIYYFRFAGIYNALLGRKSWYRPLLK